MHNQAIKFAPFGRRTLDPRAVYGGRYNEHSLWATAGFYYL